MRGLALSEKSGVKAGFIRRVEQPPHGRVAETDTTDRGGRDLAPCVQGRLILAEVGIRTEDGDEELARQLDPAGPVRDELTRHAEHLYAAPSEVRLGQRGVEQCRDDRDAVLLEERLRVPDQIGLDHVMDLFAILERRRSPHPWRRR